MPAPVLTYRLEFIGFVCALQNDWGLLSTTPRRLPACLHAESYVSWVVKALDAYCVAMLGFQFRHQRDFPPTQNQPVNCIAHRVYLLAEFHRLSDGWPGPDVGLCSPSFPGNNPSALVGEVQLGNVWVHTALKSRLWSCRPHLRKEFTYRHSDRHLHHRIRPYSITDQPFSPFSTAYGRTYQLPIQCVSTLQQQTRESLLYSI